MELQAITGQLFIENGTKMDVVDVPGLLALAAPGKAARGRARDMLFAHLTLSGSREDNLEIQQNMVNVVARNYFQTTGSLTVALRKAIIESNQQLLAHNLSRSGGLIEGAITCAVLRGSELFVAQAGETVAFLGHNFGVERLPAIGSPENQPMGRSAGVDIRFFHYWIQTGSMFLLADPRLSHLSSDELDPVLVDNNIEEGLTALEAIIGEDSSRITLIEFSDEAPGYIPDAGKRMYSTSRHLPPPTNPPLRQSGSVESPQSINGTSSARQELDVEAVETTARMATSKVARVLSGVTGWLADFLTKVRPTTTNDSESTGWALPTVLALVIPLLVAAIVTGVYVQRGRAIRYGELKRDMQSNLILAQESKNDPALAFTYYESVLDLAAEAEQLRPGDSTIQDFRAEAVSGQDLLSGIARLRGRLLYQFEESLLTAIEADLETSNALFVLDSLNDNVFHISRTEGNGVELEEPRAIIYGEQVIGSHIVGEIADLVWRPEGVQVTRDGISALDRRGSLVSFYPNLEDTRAAPLGLASDWSQPGQIATFNERLYILDPGARKIWRYFAEGDGFTLSDEQRVIEFVDDPDLDQVVDFEIFSEDGSVILLYHDGRLRRYVNGRAIWTETELAANGLSDPLVTPNSLRIAGSGLNQSLFVADPGSDRLLQFSLGGTFLAEFKVSDELGNELIGQLNDFVVVDGPLQIFFVTDDSLYTASQ